MGCIFSDSRLEIDSKDVTVADIKILVVVVSGVGKTTLIHEACFGKILNIEV
jgi:GTPase SAR1 family protein